MIGNALITAAIFLLPGYAGWLAFGESLRRRVTAVTTLFLILLGSLVTVSWLGILLAETGLFSLPLLLGVVIGGSLIVGTWAIRNGRSPNPFRRTRFQPVSLLALPILALAVWLSPQPFEYINGGRDHGLYVNTGIHIAQTGGILIHDADLTAVPPASRPLLTNPETSVTPKIVPGPWSQGQRLPGLTIRSLADGIIAPHAFHLYPVWIAIFYAIGSLGWALYATVALGLLGALSLYAAAARLFGQPVGLLAFFLLIISLAQVWYTQSPSAEILLQPLFWGGLLAFSLLLATGDRYTAVLAGLSFGLMHFTKLDTIFIPLILLLFFLYRWFRGRCQPGFKTFIITYSLVALHAALHAFFIAAIYFLDQMTRVLLPDFLAQIVVNAANGYPNPADILRRLAAQNAGFIVAGLVGLGFLLWTARRFRTAVGRQLARAERRAHIGLGLIAAGLGAAMIGVYLIQSFHPVAQLANPWQFLTFSGWYLTPLGLLLGVVGLAQVGAGRRQNRPSLNFAWLMLAGNVLPLFLLGAGTFPDQFWAIRRFVPIVLPAFILFAATVLWNLVPRRRAQWAGALLPLGLAGAIVMGQGLNLRPFLRFTDYKGLTTQVAQLAASFPPDAVLLFERSDPANRVTAPLWLIFNWTVFSLEPEAIEDPALLPAVEKWTADGRSIFWLGTNGATPPEQAGLSLSYESVQTLAVPLAEGPVGRLPQSVGLYLATFDVHRVTLATAVHPTVTTIAVGRGENGLAAEGLYPPHQLPGLTPRRWTSGQVTLNLPTSGQLAQISLMMGNGRPGGVPRAEAAVYLNDTLLGTARVAGVNDVFDFAIPPELVSSGETAVLRLEMEPWVAAQTGSGRDQRTLGVLLDWVKLIEIKND